MNWRNNICDAIVRFLHSEWMGREVETGFAVYALAPNYTHAICNKPAAGLQDSMPSHAPSLGQSPYARGEGYYSPPLRQLMYSVHTHPYSNLAAWVQARKLDEIPTLYDFLSLRKELECNWNLPDEAILPWHPVYCIIAPKAGRMLQFQVPTSHINLEYDEILDRFAEAAQPVYARIYTKAQRELCGDDFETWEGEPFKSRFIPAFPPFLLYRKRMIETLLKVGCTIKLCSINDFLQSPHSHFLAPSRIGRVTHY